MLNGKFISINGNICNAAYITTIRKISDDITQSYGIKVIYINRDYDRVYYDSAFKRDEDYNRILQELTNN